MEKLVVQSLNFDTSKAACRGQDTHLFYPDNSCKDRGARFYQQKAIDICNKCEVKDPCLEYAVRYEPTGVWGGKTEVEREVIRIQKQIILPTDRLKPDSVKRARRPGRLRKMILKGVDE